MSAQPRPFRAGAQSTFPLPGPLSVGDLLDRAFRLYRARFGLFLLTAAIFLIPVAVISGLFMGSFISSYMQAAELLLNEAIDPGFDPFSYFSDNFGGYFGGMLLLGLLSIAANSIVTLSLTAQCIETLHGRSMTLAEGIRRGRAPLLALYGHDDCAGRSHLRGDSCGVAPYFWRSVGTGIGRRAGRL